MSKSKKNNFHMNILKRAIKQQESLELLWAEYYKLSISDKPWLKSLPLYPGRWAGNFAYFYLLNRVLTNIKPKNILEFGMGQSTRFINSFLENELLDSKHTVVEHDQEWIDFFLLENTLSNRVTIEKLDLITKDYDGYTVPAYNLDGFKSINTRNDFNTYDLIIVDGPFGSNKNFSRTDILKLIEDKPEKFDNSIFIIDDTHRKGELNTLKRLVDLKSGYLMESYHGSSSVGIAVPEKLKFLLSL
jgi:hypothetical protein